MYSRPFSAEGERCVVSSWSLFKRLEVDDDEEEESMIDLGRFRVIKPLVFFTGVSGFGYNRCRVYDSGV